MHSGKGYVSLEEGGCSLFGTRLTQIASFPPSCAKRKARLAMTIIVVENNECRIGRVLYSGNIRKHRSVEFHRMI
jgi:hypothetical protein